MPFKNLKYKDYYNFTPAIRLVTKTFNYLGCEVDDDVCQFVGCAFDASQNR